MVLPFFYSTIDRAPFDGPTDSGPHDLDGLDFDSSCPPSNGILVILQKRTGSFARCSTGCVDSDPSLDEKVMQKKKK